MVDSPAPLAQERPPEHLTQVGVVCPRCHFRQFVEVEFDKPVTSAPMVQEIRAQLEAWMATHCPEHLRAIPQASRN
jgi:hypothetical protein